MAFIDPNNFELVALDTALNMLIAFTGEHSVDVVEETNGRSIKKKVYYYDLPFKQWPDEMVKELVEVICAGYVGSLQDQAEQAQIALRKVTIVPPVGAERFPSFTTNSDLP